MAVGSHECVIDIYKVTDQADFQKKLTLPKKHSSFIAHMDWTQGSDNIQSTSGAYELLFWDVAGGKQNASGATALKDATWATWTLPLGWPV